MPDTRVCSLYLFGLRPLSALPITPLQSDFIAAKRAKEELASRLKVEAQNAVRAREKAIFDARIALVRHLKTLDKTFTPTCVARVDE